MKLLNLQKVVITQSIISIIWSRSLLIALDNFICFGRKWSKAIGRSGIVKREKETGNRRLLSLAKYALVTRFKKLFLGSWVVQKTSPPKVFTIKIGSYTVGTSFVTPLVFFGQCFVEKSGMQTLPHIVVSRLFSFVGSNFAFAFFLLLSSSGLGIRTLKPTILLEKHSSLLKSFFLQIELTTFLFFFGALWRMLLFSPSSVFKSKVWKRYIRRKLE